MGIPYPGGVELDKIAEEGDENAYQLPHPHVEGAPPGLQLLRVKKPRC